MSMATASSSTDLQRMEDSCFGIAPYSLSHTATSKTPYDVFINHRGTDVKLNLASTIYHTLTKLGVNVFLDQNSLQLGDFIPMELQDVMRSASIHIAIFSRNYAQSTWCLRELSFMLKTGTKIIPVFYDVQPSDLRWVAEGKGVYVKAFAQHEKKGRENSETLKEWKAALKGISNCKGYEFRTNDDEGVLLKSIVDCVQRELNKKKVPLYVAKHPVGLDVAVEDFENCIFKSAQGNGNICFVGIVGMAGSGKTTLARELYNQKFSLMERSSFISDVRDAAHKIGMLNLQKKLLENIVGHGNFRFDHVNEGKIILSGHLKSVRMLLVLDDVDDVEQLDALLPDKESFRHDSLIIVTTCHLNVLQSSGISSIFRINLLNIEHARRLFCCYAFALPEPAPEFEDLVIRFVNLCDGLPLSLKVFGQMVHGRSKDFWESKLGKISRILPRDIVQKLEVIYDCLEEEEQQMFLDTACFFIGEKKTLAIAIWDGAGWSGLQGWETLVNKCLVELDQHQRIRMHHHLRDLGEKIANKSSPYRIWVAEQIYNTRKHTEVRTEIRGIMAAKTQFAGIYPHREFPVYSDHYRPPFEECMELMENSNRGFESLRCSLLLELLVVSKDYFTSTFAELSSELVWLRWFDFKHKNLPSWILSQKLRVLEICGALCLEDLYEDKDHLPLQLRELTISANCGNSFDRFPSSISHLKWLKKIVLISLCGDEFRFTSLPEELCELQNLEHLELRYCRELSSLPTRFGYLKNLRHVVLSSCHELKTLPISFKDLINLQYLDLSDCRGLMIRSYILENIRKLEKLFFTGCRKLEYLPSQITDQESLRELHVEDTWLREIPTNLYRLSKLETLKIGSPLLTNLPDSLNCLPSLTHLFIKDCISLRSLPDYIDTFVEGKKGLAQLQHLCIESSQVSCLPLLSICKLTNLQTLKISDCPISELCLRLGSLVKLKIINLTETAVTRISISEECCPSLETLQLEQNDRLEEIETLPTSVKTIELLDCIMLQNIRCLPALKNLENLEITECPKMSDCVRCRT